MGGDFNSIRFIGELRNGLSLIVEMIRFSEVIKELSLKDLLSFSG